MSANDKQALKPWEFRKMEGYDALHKLQGTTPEPHEGYFRHNDGSFVVSDSNGDPVALVVFKGKAKRGQAWNAPDPEGIANGLLIAAAPEMYELVKHLAAHCEGTDAPTGIECRAIIAKVTGKAEVPHV